jgi:hypothetical protein
MASDEMVYGICSNRNVLEAAVESLKNAGFSRLNRWEKVA